MHKSLLDGTTILPVIGGVSGVAVIWMQAADGVALSDGAMNVVGWGDMTLCRAVRDEVMMYIVGLGGVVVSAVAMPVAVAGGEDGVGWDPACLAGVDCQHLEADCPTDRGPVLRHELGVLVFVDQPSFVYPKVPKRNSYHCSITSLHLRIPLLPYTVRYLLLHYSYLSNSFLLSCL